MGTGVRGKACGVRGGKSGMWSAEWSNLTEALTKGTKGVGGGEGACGVGAWSGRGVGGGVGVEGVEWA